jgi:hypothetical protein
MLVQIMRNNRPRKSVYIQVLRRTSNTYASPSLSQCLRSPLSEMKSMLNTSQLLTVSVVLAIFTQTVVLNFELKDINIFLQKQAKTCLIPTLDVPAQRCVALQKLHLWPRIYLTFSSSPPIR